MLLLLSIHISFSPNLLCALILITWILHVAINISLIYSTDVNLCFFLFTWESLGTSASYSCALGQEAWRTPPDRDVVACHHLVPVTQTQNSTIHIPLQLHKLLNIVDNGKYRGLNEEFWHLSIKPQIMSAINPLVSANVLEGSEDVSMSTR